MRGNISTVIQPSAFWATRRSAPSTISGLTPEGRGFEAIQTGHGCCTGLGSIVTFSME